MYYSQQTGPQSEQNFMAHWGETRPQNMMATHTPHVRIHMNTHAYIPHITIELNKCCSLLSFYHGMYMWTSVI